MEPFQAHPIPQNVTNFEFHLVGDMTLRQFGYLGAGIVIAFVMFTTMATSYPLVAWPIILISALTGVAFAFLPIQERPLDHWVGAFFKAIFKPTKLQYSSKILSKDDPFFRKRLMFFLNTHSKKINALTQIVEATQEQGSQIKGAGFTAKKAAFLDRFQQQQTATGVSQPISVTAPSTAATISPAPQPVASSQKIFEPVTVNAEAAKAEINEPPKTGDLKKTVELAKEAQETQKEIQAIEQQISMVKEQAAQPGVDVKFYVEKFEDLLSELQKLNKQATETAHDLAVLSRSTQNIQTTKSLSSTPATLAPVSKSVPTVKLTSFANIINGIVTDAMGNYVEGAVVVAHDKQGLPVRALKSNKLGQFVAATPLPTGTYTIVVEKDNLVFDNVSVELKNEILPAVIISARKVVSGNQAVTSQAATA